VIFFSGRGEEEGSEEARIGGNKQKRKKN